MTVLLHGRNNVGVSRSTAVARRLSQAAFDSVFDSVFDHDAFGARVLTRGTMRAAALATTSECDLRGPALAGFGAGASSPHRAAGPSRFPAVAAARVAARPPI
ncbi:hypothetical protein Msi02_82510 [Microbispora siamensis]|uniref:Uncharacterized protein n=1 Tax=Microbispora siamensis TaxID=564413 RepID=A0ABQ4H165_9ACTN|nr:hypothetical protein Msi02_82510 [Microbispora siamensis]